jgi:hypothetical protein
VDYYFIDFGLSIRSLVSRTFLDYGIYGQDCSVPEMPIDPFKSDVYQLGT